MISIDTATKLHCYEIKLSVGELGLGEEVEGKVKLHEGMTRDGVRSVKGNSPGGVRLGGDVGNGDGVVREDDDLGRNKVTGETLQIGSQSALGQNHRGLGVVDQLVGSEGTGETTDNRQHTSR